MDNPFYTRIKNAISYIKIYYKALMDWIEKHKNTFSNYKGIRYLLNYLIDLIILMNKQLEILEEELQNLYEQKKEIFNDKIFFDANFSKIQRHTIVQNVSYTLLEIISNANKKDIPFEFLYPLKDLFNKVSTKNDFEYNLVFQAKWQINYSIRYILSDLKNFLPDHFENIESFLNKFTIESIVLSFPYTLKEMPLIHSLYGHELGHYFYKNQNIHDQIFTTDFSKILSKYPDPIINKLKFKIHKWVNEIVSDIFALRIFGFSFLYSFIWIFSTDDISGPLQSTHPPNCLRFYFLNEIIKRNSNKYQIFVDYEINHIINEHVSNLTK